MGIQGGQIDDGHVVSGAGAVLHRTRGGREHQQLSGCAPKGREMVTEEDGRQPCMMAPRSQTKQKQAHTTQSNISPGPIILHKRRPIQGSPWKDCMHEEKEVWRDER
mmetsp:Transcript_504/g.3647  ORF Transcript_504/g.3647 Transcript_504/m.3647 type:complete len:107 (+) Transcript_504:114-434(+)